MGATVSFRCSEELLLEVDRYAAARNLGRSSAVRAILRESLLSEHERALGEVVRPIIRRELDRAAAAGVLAGGRAGAAESIAGDVAEVKEALAALLPVAAAGLWLQILSAHEEHEGSMEEWRRVAGENAGAILEGSALADPVEGSWQA